VTSRAPYTPEAPSSAARLDEIDLLVNNAGLALGREPAQQTQFDDWQQMIATNIAALAHATQVLLPGMVERGRGHVVNIGSLAAKAAVRWMGAYPATKFAMASYSQQLRLEHGPEGLHVLLVCPGPVDRKSTRLNSSHNPASRMPSSA
jgi:NADP-dependent 3-hydroxy acid dehydrogenase YdfG